MIRVTGDNRQMIPLHSCFLLLFTLQGTYVHRRAPYRADLAMCKGKIYISHSLLFTVPHKTHSDYYQCKGGIAHVVLPFYLVVLSYTQSTTRIDLDIKLHTYSLMARRERLRLRVVGVG